MKSYGTVPGLILAPGALFLALSLALQAPAWALRGQEAIENSSRFELQAGLEEAPDRLKAYSHMEDSAKWVGLLERLLDRPLSAQEREEALYLMSRLSEVHEKSYVTQRLDRMLEKGGRPNVCLDTTERAMDILDGLSVPYAPVVKYYFIHYENENTTLFPFDDRVRELWWDFGEGDAPVHRFLVFDFLGIPFVLDLSADQFVMAQEKPARFIDQGVLIIPAAELKEWDWPYVGGINGSRRRDRLSGVLKGNSILLDRVSGENPSAGLEERVTQTLSRAQRQLPAGLEEREPVRTPEVGRFESVDALAAAYPSILKGSPGAASILEGFRRRGAGAWVVPDRRPTAAMREVRALARPLDPGKEESLWELALEDRLNRVSDRIKEVFFSAAAYPADGKLPDLPAVAILEAGASLPAEPDRPVAVIEIQSLKEVEELFPQWVYSVAMSRLLRGKVIGPVIGVLTFEDERGRVLHAIFA